MSSHECEYVDTIKKENCNHPMSYLAEHHHDLGAVDVVLALAVAQRRPQHGAQRVKTVPHIHLDYGDKR